MQSRCIGTREKDAAILRNGVEKEEERGGEAVACPYSADGCGCLEKHTRSRRHRLPSGFGTVRFLGKGRRRPYAVHPPAEAVEIEIADKIPVGELLQEPVQEPAENPGETPMQEPVDEPGDAGLPQMEMPLKRPSIGSNTDDPCVGRREDVRTHRIWKRPPAICYVSTREIGRRILRLYHAGEYREGMEREIEQASMQEQKKSSTALAGQEVILQSKGKGQDVQMQENSSTALAGQETFSPKTQADSLSVDEKRASTAENALPAAGRNRIATENNSKAEECASIGFAFGSAVPIAEEAFPKKESPSLQAGDPPAFPKKDSSSLQAGNPPAFPKKESPSLQAGDPPAFPKKDSPSLQAGDPPAFPKKDSPSLQAGDPPAFPQEDPPAGDLLAGNPPAGSFAEAYAAFYEHKFGVHANRNLSKSTRNAMNAAYKKFAPLYNVPIDDITVDDLQNVVNGAADDGYSKSAVRQMVTLAHQFYKYAFPRELCKKDWGRYVEMPGCTVVEEHHQDFTDEELKILWKNYRKTGDPIVRMILVMCYSGFRIGEFEDSTFRVCLPEELLRSGSDTREQERAPQQRSDTPPQLMQQLMQQSMPKLILQSGSGTPQHENGKRGSDTSGQRRRSKKAKMAHSPAYFQGGLKTEAGRNRIVPIHSAILPLVQEILHTAPTGKPVFFCGRKSGWFRRKMKEKLIELGIDTPIAETDTGMDEIKTAPAAHTHTAPAAHTHTTPAVNTRIHTLPAARIHTPHSTRHTFSRLCESYGVDDADRRRMLGHSFGSDITNGIYGHRSVEELCAQIEKIKVR